jgi:hypothetical protein
MNNSGVYKITEQTPKNKKIADTTFGRNMFINKSAGRDPKTYNKSLSLGRTGSADRSKFSSYEKNSLIPKSKNTSTSTNKIPRAQNPMMSSKNSLQFSDILDNKINLKSNLLYRHSSGKSIDMETNNIKKCFIPRSSEKKITNMPEKKLNSEKKVIPVPKIPMSEKSIKSNINKEYFLAKYKNLIKMNESEEIRIIREVYFLGHIANRSENGVIKEDSDTYDDNNGNYNIRIGDHINYRYEILSELGQGSFGQAIKCLDHKTKEKVCIKIIKNKKKFAHQAKIEINILNYILKNDDKGEANMVKMIDNFIFRNHIVNYSIILVYNI